MVAGQGGTPHPGTRNMRAWTSQTLGAWEKFPRSPTPYTPQVGKDAPQVGEDATLLSLFPSLPCSQLPPHTHPRLRGCGSNHK